MTWTPIMVLPAKQIIDVTLLPVFTVAPNPTSGTEQVTITITPSMQSTPPAPAGTPPTPIGQVSPQSFDWLIEALIKWGMQTLIGATTGPITAVDLLLIYEDLTAADISQRGFDYTDLASFLADNLVFALTAPDLSRNPATELPSAVLPMLPPLTMTPEGQPAVDFSQAPQVGTDYQQFVQSILDKLVVNYGYDRAPDPMAGQSGNGLAGRQRTMLRAGGEPITEALFADWLLMVARSSVQIAVNELKQTAYDSYAGQSLAALAAALAPAVAYKVRAGDTIASIAELFGISTAALTAANGSTITPGQVLTVPAPTAMADYVTLPGDTLAGIATGWSVSQDAIVAANPAGTDFSQPGTAVQIPVPAALFDLAAANLTPPLAATPLPIGGLSHAVRAGDSLSLVAGEFGTDSATLAGSNANQPGLLLANGTATVQLARADGTGAQYTIATGDTLNLIAAYVVVRDLNGAGQPEGAWYANAITTANGPFDGTSPLQVPLVQRTATGLLQQTGVVSYPPKAGDTIELIGGYFTLAQLYPDSLATVVSQLEQLNPGLNPGNVPVGRTITLPVRSHVIVAGDTLAGLAARFGLQVSDLAGQQVNATAAILTPNATVQLPAGLRYPVPANSTLQSLAATLALTVDALVGRIGAVPSLFVAGTALALPNARQADVDTLIKQLIGSGQTASVAGMASHFMLHGLRLPMPPNPSSTDIQALYRITGQQFPAPASITGSYTIGFAADGTPTWAQPVLIHQTQPGETIATIATQYQNVTVAQILAANPGIDPNHPPATVRIPQPAVNVTLDQATLTAQSPSLSFDPAITAGPQRQPLFYAAPVAHSVGPQINWTAPLPPNLGSQTTGGSPSLWRLPATLLAQLAAGQISGSYLLGQVAKGAQASNPPLGVDLWSWATFLPLTVRRVATPEGGTLPGTYQLVGANQTDRDVLLSLWTSLQASGSAVQLFLAYPGANGGLVSDPLTADDRAGRVAVLKANLSTITSSGAQAELRGTAIPPYTAAYATLAAPVQFLQLAWEASITGSGGFYLNYSTATGAGLPPATFAGGQDGQLTLIAVVGDPSTPDRTLHPYTTGAVVGYNLDPSKVDVFAYAETGDTTVVPTAPPGNIGFSLSRTDPAPGISPDAETRTQSLFSLLAFELTGTGFTMPAISLPAGPQSPAAAVWDYQQTVPVAKLWTDPPPDAATGALPAGADNPYLGIARVAGANGPFLGAWVDLTFAFRDVFGNELAAAKTIPDVKAPISYYDPVRGLGSWPGAGGHFDITGATGAAVLTVRLDLGLDKYVPGPANPFAAAVRTAAAHQVSYRQVFYQLSQQDLYCTVDSSLDQPAGPALVSGAAAKRPLQAFATASYLYLGAASAVQQVEHQVTGSETLGGLASANALSPAQLVSANAAADVSKLTAAALTIPHDWAVRSSDTLGSIAVATGIAVPTLLTTNAAVPLNAGCVLPTATRTFTTRPANSAANRPADTFSTVAAVQDTDIASVAIANTGNAGILNPGQVSIGGVTLPVSKTDSLGSLVTAFAGRGVTTTVVAIATAYANSGLLATGVPIAIAAVPATPNDRTGVRSHPVAQGESLAHIAEVEHCTLSGLVLANAQLTGLLTPGTPVEVKGLTAPVPADGSLAGLLDALLAAAVTSGTEVVLGLDDIGTALAVDDKILVQKAALAITDYVVQPRDTIAGLVQNLPGFSIAQLARLAAPGPQGIYPTGTSLRLSTSSYQPLPGDTFALIAAEFGIGTDELAAANDGLPLSLRAVLAIPGATTLGADSYGGYYVPLSGPAPALNAVATATGMTLNALGEANATMPGLLAPNIKVTYQGNSTTTSTESTLASVATAVHAADAGALAADPTVAAMTDLVALGALFVIGAVPPAGRSLNGMAADLGVQVSNLAAGQSPAIALATANSAVVGLVTDGKSLTVNGVTVTASSADTLASLVRRLQQAAPAGQPPIELTDLLAAYAGDAGLLAGNARLLVPPPQVSLGGSLASPYIAGPFSELSASITIARDSTLVDPLAADIPAVFADTTTLSPNLGPDGQPDVFAQAFETAFANRRLKLATGPQPGGGTGLLWVVDFAATGISAVQLQPDAPAFFALQPMSQQLESGTATVAAYDPDTGGLGVPSKQAFASVDIDAWMRTALEAIDLFLAPSVAAPAWTVNPASFTTIVQDKETIAGALATRVQQVLVGDVTQAGLDAAQEALRQSMLNSLATGYTTDAVVQFPVTVDSPFLPVQTTGSNGATLSQLGTGYKLSPQAVALAFADVPYVLFVGATVRAGNLSHQIVGSDTLTSVAAALRLADVTQLPNDQVLFAANITLDLVPMTKPVAAGDTFGTLAGYFATDPGSVGTAVQYVTGLLTPGQTITFGGHSHPVTGNDTLSTVAGSLNTTPATLAAAPGVVGNANLLVAGTPVACFSPLNPVPPRLVGKPVATRYTVPASGDVAGLLALFEVSLVTLAEALAGTGGLVSVGVQVGSHVVVEGDTLSTIGAALDPARDVPTLLAEVLNGSLPVTGGTLFRPGATIALSKLSRTPTSTDSFATLADYFGQAPADVAVANQDLAGVFVAKVSFVHQQHNYTTNGTETIGYVAGQLAYDSVTAFATDPAVVVRTGIFATSQPMHALQAVPDFSLSSLKVPLTDGTQYASFLFSTAADARYRSLFLDLDLVIDEVEYSIQDVPGAPGYQGSDWLRFPLALQHSCLGGAVELDADGTDVPIALRSYPQLPLVRALEAEPTWGSPDWPITTIAQAKQWQLELIVEHQASAQDEMQLKVSFGSPDDAFGMAAADLQLLQPLAQFVIAWADMQHDVAALSALAPGATDPRLGQLVATFAGLVDGLAKGLTSVSENRFADAVEQTYQFSLDTTFDATDNYLDSVNVTLLSGPSENIPWPAISVAIKGVQTPLVGQGVVDNQSQRYGYPAGVPAFTALTHQFVFPGTGVVPAGGKNPPVGRDAVQWQYGQSLVSVLRNALLVPGKPTYPTFIYQTPWIGFANPAVPLLQSAAAIQVGTGPDITSGVQTALTQLLGSNADINYAFRMLCHYERRLAVATGAGESAAIVSPLPVFYVPLARLKLGGIADFAHDAGVQAATWLSTAGIQQTPGDAFVLDISVYSNNDTQMTRPLVELTGLTIPIS
ncbi:MAG TPA: LysM peptidoglycan-binding domain-containing protein [Jatrophihabitans sp.]|nr:LysM peptidoglycan-binding domain-containing protein [Jatrophihabitans sp.]